jgi:hypothetical protein
MTENAPEQFKPFVLQFDTVVKIPTPQNCDLERKTGHSRILKVKKVTDDLSLLKHCQRWFLIAERRSTHLDRLGADARDCGKGRGEEAL